MNTLTLDMIVRLADAWDLLDGDASIRSAILTGAGDAYCTGGDMTDGWMGRTSPDSTEHEVRGAGDPELMLKGLLVTHWVRTPIIAAVNGDCLGGGCEMLQSTDIRIAEEHARFGVPEARRGLIAGAGSTMRLKRQIPYAVAMEMLLTGRILDAEEALRIVGPDAAHEIHGRVARPAWDEQPLAPDQAVELDVDGEPASAVGERVRGERRTGVIAPRDPPGCAERLGHRGHGRGSTHGHAMSCTAGYSYFCFQNIFC
jgi:enoyl-CoA hydratase/carnithine racemase